MPYLEYPKVVYRGEGDASESRLVLTREAEDAAALDGFAALPSVPPSDDAIDGAPVEHLEYPKVLYKGDEQRVVKDAEADAAAVTEGFGPFGTPAEEKKKGRFGR